MRSLVFAIASFVLGVAAGGAAVYWHLDEEHARERAMLMTLHGDNRAAACQQPPERRPRDLDCRGLAP